MIPSVLVVEDDSSMCAMLEAGLEKLGFDVTSHRAAGDAFELLGTRDFDVVVTDLNLHGMTGIELCEHIVETRPDVPVIVITAFGSLDTAIAAIRAGAYDFIPKPFELDALSIALDRAVQHRRLREEVKRLRVAGSEARRFGEILGASAAMRKVYDFLDRVVDSNATVLITGESGTGKEHVARALHEKSSRRGGSFIAVDCAALPESLLESELFGHTSGAFTDAKRPRTGLFVQANGGTLFLDEIGEMPLGLQPKLLRALQERRIRPLGSDIEVSFDARIVTATNRDLETAVEDGRFRGDLYYRINVIHVRLPPLRARGNDVLMLAHSFVEHYVSSTGKRIHGLSSKVAGKLLAYPWPGNVRELQNCIERAVAVARYEEITVDDLPEQIRRYRRTHVVVDTQDPTELIRMDELERRYIFRVLDAVHGNKTLAAEILGFDRRTLYRKLERYQEAMPKESWAAEG